MAQLVVRNLEASVKTRLQRRARRHGRSMEEEAREILRHAVRADGLRGAGLGSDIVALFSGIGLTREIPELRGHGIAPVTFDQ
jgi:plasmid stability protein